MPSLLLTWALAGLWSPNLAMAQSPGMPPGSIPLNLPGLSAGLSTSSGNARWMTSEVTSKRFPGEDVAGPVFKSGEEVEWIVTDGASARIRQGARYGWVPAASLSESQPLVMPESPGLEPGGNPLLGGLAPLAPAPVAPVPPSPTPPKTP